MFPLFIDRDPIWKLTKSWKLTHMLTNISRISKNLTHSIACAYSDIDFAHSWTSQALLIALWLIRHWLKLLQIACTYSDIDFAHSQTSQTLLNSYQKWHNLVMIPFCELSVKWHNMLISYNCSLNSTDFFFFKSITFPF